jgi:hypothetical protein
VEWDSYSHWTIDPSLKSVVFTLKNPHNFPAREFALKAEEKDFAEAIVCDSSRRPHFADTGISDHCNANTNSWSRLGRA